jgi:D-alanyl-D-alanine carboxypeptidase/D-alanyl-D-alanine-endopeptidase (penicillin-binding protein 4)
LCRSNGIVLRSPELTVDPTGGRILARAESAPLSDMVRSMLKYSTNLTAECIGLTASGAMGVPVSGLLASGSRMAGWAETQFGATRLKFRDHSGLGYGSEIGAEAMARILQGAPDLRENLTGMNVPTPGDKNGNPLSGVDVRAKTGTLNFVSTLAGYATTRSGRELCFAIFTADTPKRDAIPPEARERPPGARGWSRRSRGLQKALLGEWLTTL